jgi:nucleoid DNA-binding protein
MNLTKIIEETGRRIRAGKMPAEKLTNADVKEVLEAAIEVMKQALIEEERIEIQDFAVIEVKRTAVKPTKLNGKVTRGERKRWVIKPSQNSIKSDCLTQSTKV